MKTLRSAVVFIGLLALGCGGRESKYAGLAGKTISVEANAMPKRRAHVISAWGAWLTCRITHQEAMDSVLDSSSHGKTERQRLADQAAWISRLESDIAYVEQRSGMVDSGKVRELEDARRTLREWTSTLSMMADHLVDESAKHPFMINMTEVLSYSVEQDGDGSTP